MTDIAPSGEPVPLEEGWQLLVTDAGQCRAPAELPGEGFIPARVPGTVAGALREAGRLSLDSPDDLDARDAWYRCRFERPKCGAGARVLLHLDGLATLSDVFLNGACVISSDSMFVRHAVDVTNRLEEANELAIRFRALRPEMKTRKPRPRWRTKLVADQQLRFFRTTLLGRMPGIGPAIAPVGPFRPVRMQIAERVLHDVRLRSMVEGTDGIVSLRADIDLFGEDSVRSATLTVAGREQRMSVVPSGNGVTVAGEIRVADAPLWWPHTHGAQPLFPVELSLELSGGRKARHPCGRVGFRRVIADTGGGGFTLHVNGTPMFCRGACWTPLDVVSLSGTPAEYRAVLELAREAGMNMLRVGGTMLYEAIAFYDACDELGILVWQDFMFANMDYPVGDEDFMRGVRGETSELLGRLGHRPSLAVLCGNSEVAQQAAMLGLPRDAWSNALFDHGFSEMMASAAVDVPYWPSSPSGGVLPFSVSAGVAHYYGVGAYERPLDDARRANVRFTTECLAFANVPDDAALERLSPDGAPPVHHPIWKARVPRDRGAGWDFDDVRDHYLERLFRVSARDLRYGDKDRYLELSRVTTGEVMHRTFAEWRRPGSTCRGGLVWFFRDLWEGAGWGVLDALGRPKPAYWYLRRILKPRALLVSDEGLDGLVVHAINEHDAAMEVEIRATLYHLGETPVAEGAACETVPARSEKSVQLQSLLETFVDVTYAYRFGPPSHDLVVVRMTEKGSGEELDTAFYFPLGASSAREAEIGLEATVEATDAEHVAVTVSTRRFARSVHLGLKGGRPEDDYFHLAPLGRRRVLVKLDQPGVKLQGTVHALNAHAGTRLRAV